MKDEALARRCRALELGMAIPTEAGHSAPPQDAPLEVRLAAFMVTGAGDGEGCPRELAEAIPRAGGDRERAATALGAILP